MENPSKSRGLRAAAVNKPGHGICRLPLIEFHGFAEDRLALVVRYAWNTRPQDLCLFKN
jgi:hypothetical protein